MENSLIQRQDSRILQLYNVYRIVLSAGLLTVFLTSADAARLGSENPRLFLQVTIGYVIFALMAAIAQRPGQQETGKEKVIAALMICDIIVVGVLTYTCGGVVSGLGLLLIITVASGSALIRGRLSTFLAAIASITIIYSEVYLAFTSANPPRQYLQSGLLGILLFATSLYLQFLTERMRRSTALAEQQATSIVDLEKLNHLIIQRMRTGILVANSADAIITTNSAAEQMLELPQTKKRGGRETFRALPTVLALQLSRWRRSQDSRMPTFRIRSTGPPLQANFAFLNPSSDSDILVFIEDHSQLIQRVRQMKLVSLGRLTASIAHEIRNPLGAISHANQLLSESGALETGDQRMIEIISAHCERVNRIIDDILHVSRQSELPSQKINLQQWLERFIQNYCETHQVSGGITLEIDPPGTMVRVIQSQFEQILNNLFENGLRYSERASGRGSLHVKGGLSGRADNPSPYLHIIDEGPGVPPQGEDQLFEPFYTTESSGTGLGLYISRELCEANQARLSYKRTSEGKSCFQLNFSHPDRNVI